ncbi:MAG TPA: DUF4124 domain-containing protein [Gammaproteobacteria bacterium]|nr:DUF4124 domain-containing protein [Gammaproteobacteria bacterium]
MKAGLLLAALLLALPGMADAKGGVYRCVTESGAVRYADRPCPDGKSEKLDIENRPTDPEAIRESAEQRRARLEALDRQAEVNAESEARRREREQERQRLCQAARDRLERLMRARRVTVDENGEQRYLESEEIIQRRQDAQDQVNEYCGR